MKKLALFFGFFVSCFYALTSIFEALCTRAAHLQFAISQNALIGRTKGRVGGVVFSHIFGKNVIKTLPVSVRPNNSIPRLHQRAKFSLVLAFLRESISLIKLGFREQAVGKSAFNAGQSYNVLHGVTGSYPNEALDYANILIAKGSLTGGSALVSASYPGLQVAFSWTDNTGEGNAAATDELSVLCYEPTSKTAYVSEAIAVRSAETATFTLPAAAGGKHVKVYGFFASVTDNKCSDSEYLGDITVQA